MFKQGDQFYLQMQITDKNDNVLDINGVKKVQFNLGELTKTYDGESTEVTYNNETQCFEIWLTEEETFNMDNYTKLDVRVLFKNNTIMGSYIDQKFIYDSLKEVLLDVTTNKSENNE